MNIIQTKLRKELVETPELRTNTALVSNVITQDVIINDRSVAEVLFSNEKVTEHGPYLTTELFPTGSGSKNAIRIRMFEINPENYRDKSFKSVTVYKGTGYDFGSSDFASVANNPNGVWLFVDCIKHITNEEGQIIEEVVVDRKFSINRANQTGGRDEETTTTWEFIPFVLKDEYDVLQFRLTNQEKTPIYPTSTSSSHALLLKSSNYGGDGWKTLDQNKVVDVSANNMNKTNDTAKVSFMLQTSVAGFTTHTDDETIHVTQKFKDDVNEHLQKDDIHVLKSEKDAWNNHIGDTTHLTEAQKTSIDKISTINAEFFKHKNTHEIHVTQADKDKWNSIEIPEQIVYAEGNNIAISDENVISVVTTDVIDNSEAIPTAKGVYNTFYEDKSFNNLNPEIYSSKDETVGTVVLSKKHFISGGRITKVEIPHGTTETDRTNGQGGYLVIEVFAEDNTKEDGYDKSNPIHRYYADDYYAYKNRLDEGKYSWTFNKTECIIPNDYKAVHLSLVIQNTTIPAVGSNNNAKFRITCLVKNNTEDEEVVYEENDECCVYWHKQNTRDNYVAIVNVDYTVDKIKKQINETINPINETLTLHKNDNNSHFTIGEKSEITRSIQSYNEFYEKYLYSEDTINEYKTKEICNQSGNGTAARLHAWYMNVENYKGQYLTQIEVPYPANIIASSDPASQTPLQLYIECFDENGNSLNEFFYSTNKQSQTSEGLPMIWTFNKVFIKQSYSKICFRMTKTQDTPEKPTGTATHQIVCYTYTSNPQWGVIEQNNAPKSATMNFIFTINKETLGLGTLIDNLTQRISLLEARVSELENS